MMTVRKLYGDAERPASAHGVFLGDRTRVAAVESSEDGDEVFIGGAASGAGQHRQR